MRRRDKGAGCWQRSYGLSSHGLYNYGLHSYGLLLQKNDEPQSNILHCATVIDFGQFHLLYPNHAFVFLAQGDETFATKMLTK